MLATLAMTRSARRATYPSARPRPLPVKNGEGNPQSSQLMCGPGPSAASSTAARHSRLIGRIGGIGAISGSAVAGAIELDVFGPRRFAHEEHCRSPIARDAVCRATETAARSKTSNRNSCRRGRGRCAVRPAPSAPADRPRGPGRTSSSRRRRCGSPASFRTRSACRGRGSAPNRRRRRSRPRC